MGTVLAKPFYTSKLFWVGLIQTILGILELVQKTDVLGSDVAGIIVLVSGVLTVALRFLTDRPVVASTKSRHVAVDDSR